MTDHAQVIRDTDALVEQVARALRAERDRKRGDERDYDWRRELTVSGLQALAALSADLAAARETTHDWMMLADDAEDRYEAAERDLAAAREALRAASARLGELTQPPWNELTPLVAEVRDDLRAELEKSEGTA